MAGPLNQGSAVGEAEGHLQLAGMPYGVSRAISLQLIALALVAVAGCASRPEGASTTSLSVAANSGTDQCPSLLNNPGTAIVGETPQEIIDSAIAAIDEKNIGAVIAMLSSYETRDHRNPDYGYADCLVAALTAIKEDSRQRNNISIRRISHAEAVDLEHQTNQPSIIVSMSGVQDPSEIVILGAHIDSINNEEGCTAPGVFCPAPGADDNASGVAVLVEAFRVLSNAPPTSRSVEFHFYAAEEDELRGSSAIASCYRSAGKDVIAYLNFDMVAFLDPHSKGAVFLDSSPRSSSVLNDYLLVALPAVVGEIVGSARCGLSDHASWTSARYNSASINEGHCGLGHGFQCRHSEHDRNVAEVINLSHAEKSSRIAVAYALGLANSSWRP